MKLFKNNFAEFSFILLLFIMVISRFFISYFSTNNTVAAPEAVFEMPQMGRDVYTGIYIPGENMVKGEKFYDEIASYGPAISFLVSPYISVCRVVKTRLINGMPICSVVLYRAIIAFSLIGYLVFTWLVTKKNTLETKIIVWLFLMTFFLGIPGSLGLHQGNADIFLSLLLGIAVYLLIQYRQKPKSKPKNRLVLSLFIGVTAAFLANSKIFLLPLALALVFCAPLLLTTIITTITAFAAFSYSPLIYGVKVNFFDLFQTAGNWANSAGKYFNSRYFLRFNHSFEATASLVTNYFAKTSCLAVMFIFVFIMPFRRFLGKINIFAISLIKNRKDPTVLLLFLALGSATINLIPQSSYAYRLYFSLPLAIILYSQTEKNQPARIYALLAMLFLNLKGLWFIHDVSQNGFSLIDTRFVNLLVLFHFYFLIKSSLSLLKKRYIDITR